MNNKLILLFFIAASAASIFMGVKLAESIQDYAHLRAEVPNE